MSSLRNAIPVRRIVAGALCSVTVVAVVFTGVLGGWAWVSADSIERVSVDSAEAESNATANAVSVSADGRSLVFQSTATNLVAGDTNGRQDVFIRDAVAGTTSLVSLADDESLGNRNSLSASVDGDGSRVAFRSVATNLVTGDTNALGDIFVRDLEAGTTVRVSVDSAGAQSNGDSTVPIISADGRYVTFVSAATNLVAGDTNGVADVFVHELVTGTTVRASVDSDEVEGNGAAGLPQLSADGSRVVFESLATNLVAGDTNALADIFIRDLGAGTTTLVSVSTAGTVGSRESERPYISADGSKVSFESLAIDLVTGDVNNRGDVFVRDLTTSETELVSVATDGTQSSTGSGNGVISGDGRWVAFRSIAPNLVSGDTNGEADIFLRDLVLGDTTRMSLAYDGAEANSYCWNPFTDYDGSVVTFESVATNLVAGDTNAVSDVFAVGVIEDTTPPVTTDDAPTMWQNIASISVELTATDDLSGLDEIRYAIDEGTLTTYAGLITVTDEGETVIEYSSVDVAGNVEASATASVLIDRTNPTSSDDVPVGWQSSDVTVTLSGSDAVSALDDIMWGPVGGPMAPYTGPFQVTDEGETVIEYFAVDLAGNQDDTVTVSVFLDKSAPVTTSDAKSSYRTSGTVSLTATDTYSGVDATWASVDGAPYAPYTAPIVIKGTGDHTLSFYSVDVAGNTEAVQTLDVEITAVPALPRTGAEALALMLAAAVSTSFGIGLRRSGRVRN